VIKIKNRDKIYISGPIAGNKNYQKQFKEAEEFLRKKGFRRIINPAALSQQIGWSWCDYMRRDIKLLMDCNYIFMLDGWGKSEGARLEIKIAKAIDIFIIKRFGDKITMIAIEEE